MPHFLASRVECFLTILGLGISRLSQNHGLPLFSLIWTLFLTVLKIQVRYGQQSHLLYQFHSEGRSKIMADPIELPTDPTLAEEDETSMTAEDAFNSVKISLADLCAKGTAQFAHKNYDEASDLFARASELQAELNGEMSSENAEILFLYGRSLFKVGQSKSDVLGGRAGGEKKKPNGTEKATKSEPVKETNELDKVVQEGVAIIAEQNGSAVKAEEDGSKKPLFQFTGDENFEDSEDDEVC